MKKLTTKLMLAAAALVAAAGTLSAQAVKADIPFEFRAGDRVMAAGTYQVEIFRMGAIPVLLLRGMDSDGSAVLLPQAEVAPQKEWRTEGNAKLEFACPSGNCALAEIWDGLGNFAYTFRHAAQGGDETAVLREISIQRAKAE